MNKQYLFFILFLLQALIGGSAYAVTVVDTGTPTGSSLFLDTKFASEFTLTAPTTITAVEHYMQVTNAGTASIRIYADGGDIPGGFLAVSTPFFSTGAAQWRPIGGFNLDLNPGTYWVAIEPSSSIGGFTFKGAPSPLVNEARSFTLTGSYTGVDDLNLGWRIEGTVIPVPAALPLFLGGLGLLGFLSRRKA